jgi:hypothetical protein
MRLQWNTSRSRAVLCAATTALALGYTSPAYAATPGVDPAIVDQHANPGSSFVVHKTVSTPVIPPNPDIVLLVDTTTSMGAVIAAVQSNLNSIVGTVQGAQPSAQFAVARYKDTDDEPTFAAFEVLHSLTGSPAAIQNAVNNLGLAGGGSDAPEDWINALFALGSGAITFRPNDTRVVVLVGDSSSHDPSNGHSLASAIAVLQASSIRVAAVDVGPAPAPAISDGLDSSGQATAVTGATGGPAVLHGTDANVAPLILAGLNNLPVTVSPHVVSCESGVSVSFDHGDATVTSGSSVPYLETVTVSGAAAQGAALHCTVEFLLNGVSGGPAFTEHITVRVNDVTPPVVTVDDRTVEATGPAGAVITYPATAVDNVDGTLTPTCGPASGSPFPIGHTTVTCTATDSSGNLGSDTAVMTVVDTTPPTPSCVQGPNPGGHIPPAKNPDGFYRLLATDLVDAHPVVYIHDSANMSVVFGPFAAGATIKLVQAPGATPSVRPGTGAVDYFVTLRGDAVLTAMDTTGNVSGPITCRVPPPPK